MTTPRPSRIFDMYNNTVDNPEDFETSKDLNNLDDGDVANTSYPEDIPMISELLQILIDELQRKNQIIENLRQEISDIEYHEYKVRKSSEFSEKVSECNTFMSQCHIHSMSKDE